ncbi:MAG: hypothetical protein ABUL67_00215 [Haliangium ochraceum]
MTFAQLRVALLLIAVAATACLMPAQADTYWHLRAGQDLFASGHVPLIDAYSHTARGMPWPNHEWLWQALSYAAFRTGGMPLLVLVGAAFATAACVASFRLMRARPSVNFLLAVLTIPLASVVWALRPQIASMFLLVALLHLIVAERFWVIPPLFALWANLHGAVAMGGVVLVTATGVAWFGDADRTRFKRLAIVTVCAGALTAATPMGPRLWLFIGESMARSRQNQIMEWLPSYPQGPIEIAFWVSALVLVAITWRRWRQLKSWEDRVIVAVSLVFLPLAARAVRNIAPFFLLWGPAMSRLIGPEAHLPLPGRGRPPAADPGAPVETEHPRLNIVLAALGVLGGVVAVAFCWSGPIDRLGWRPVPAAAAAAITACRGPLYNRYNEGGFLIWFVPGVPVFVDSRQDPYPASLLTAHARAEITGDARELFARYRIGCAALPPASPVVARLQTGGWRETYRDEAWIVMQDKGFDR